MPTFKLDATPQLYIRCVIVQRAWRKTIETLANTWNFESGKLIVPF